MKSPKFKKQYKALILDVDGTLIPNRRDGRPSKKVAEAIGKASKLLHVGIATSRPYFILEHIIDHLKLSGPSVISGGAQIIDTSSKKILHEQPLVVQDIFEIVKLSKKLSIPLSVYDGGYSNGKDITVSKKYIPKKPLHLWIHGITTERADSYVREISHIPTIAIHKLPSWKNGQVDVSIYHAKATKQHAILEVAKLLNIEIHEIIGVGDGYNDLPLLMACGLKVAMGNAVKDLKEIADYIAPSVEEDGVADVIEKFVL